jgi:stringent starvation protein B
VTTASTKPYLLRALYEWCVDYGFTPYLSVIVDENTQVPLEFVKDGTIVLNIGPNATRHFVLSNEEVSFHTRFNGVSREIRVPMARVNGLFARENGEGLAFVVEDLGPGVAKDSPEVSVDEVEELETTPPEVEAPSKPRHLRVIK